MQLLDKGTEVPSLSQEEGTSSKSCHLDGPGRDSLSKSGRGRGTGQSLFFCQNLGWDMGQEIFLSRDKGTIGCSVPDCPGTVPGRPVPLETLTEGEGWLSAVALVP